VIFWAKVPAHCCRLRQTGIVHIAWPFAHHCLKRLLNDIVFELAAEVVPFKRRLSQIVKLAFASLEVAH
jgi:hypothetical protein